MGAGGQYASNVFINCPFDNEYEKLFDAIVFAIFDSGFVARCALEVDDSSTVRIDRINKIIGECKFAIHDISRTELDAGSELPRFNMPLELGVFLGAKRFGDARQKSKGCLILDKERYRFQSFISDISGQDIQSHDNNPRTAVARIRNWLNSASKRKTIPGGNEIWNRYQNYLTILPELCRGARLAKKEMTFNDKSTFISEWLQSIDTNS